MTAMMIKCRGFGCDRGVPHLRWALGYRTCGRHGREATAEASRRTISLLGVSDCNALRTAEKGERNSYPPVPASRERSHAA